MVKKRYRHKPEKEESVQLTDLGRWIGVLGIILGILLIGMLCFAINEVIYSRDLSRFEEVVTDSSRKYDVHAYGYSWEDVQMIGVPCYNRPDNLSTPFICGNVTCDWVRSDDGYCICVNDSVEYVLGENFTYFATKGYEYIYTGQVVSGANDIGLVGFHFDEGYILIGAIPVDEYDVRTCRMMYPNAIVFPQCPPPSDDLKDLKNTHTTPPSNIVYSICKYNVGIQNTYTTGGWNITYRCHNTSENVSAWVKWYADIDDEVNRWCENETMGDEP